MNLRLQAGLNQGMRYIASTCDQKETLAEIGLLFDIHADYIGEKKCLNGSVMFVRIVFDSFN